MIPQIGRWFQYSTELNARLVLMACPKNATFLEICTESWPDIALREQILAQLGWNFFSSSFSISKRAM